MTTQLNTNKIIMNIKTLLIALITVTSSISVYSQNREKPNSVRFGLGLNVGVPTASNNSDFVVGPDARLQLDFTRRTSLTLTTGFYGFIGQPKRDDLIPLKAGLKFFIGSKSNYYFHPEVGAAFQPVENGRTAFAWAPALGYASAKNFDIALRYEGFEYDGLSRGMVALRLAYGFKL